MVDITAGSRKVPGRRGLWWQQQQRRQNDDDDNDNDGDVLLVENGWCPFEHHYELLGTIKSRKFIDKRSNYELLKKRCFLGAQLPRMIQAIMCFQLLFPWIKAWSFRLQPLALQPTAKNHRPNVSAMLISFYTTLYPCVERSIYSYISVNLLTPRQTSNNCSKNIPCHGTY